MRYTTETREYSTPMARVSDATGGTPTAASWATASDERNKRSGQLSAEKGRKFHNDLAGYPRQPRMPDKIPARGWKSQGKYPPRTTLPRRPVGFCRVREEPRRLLGHAKRQYVGLPFGLPFICVPGKEGAAVMHDAGRERERTLERQIRTRHTSGRNELHRLFLGNSRFCVRDGER